MDLFFIVILSVASIVGLTFIVERGLALRWSKIIPPVVESAAGSFQTEADLERVKLLCQNNPSPLGRLVLLAEAHRTWPKQENTAALETAARHEIVQMERGLVILEIVVGIAPLLGLVGTIYGLILLFRGMGQADFGGNNGAVAAGIALALNSTLFGLLTAIPSLIAWSYYSKKVETMAVEMETICDQFLRRIYAARSAEQMKAPHVIV
jgi:biopolymer transport protein ExbB